MKRLFQNILLVLIAVVIVSSSQNAFAIADRIKLNKYDPGEATYDGQIVPQNIVASCELEPLDNILNLDETGLENYFSSEGWSEEEIWGDFSMDVSSLACTGPIFAAYLVAKFGNWQAKVAAWGTLLAVAELQYAKSQEFFKNARLCGDDWYVFKVIPDEAPVFGPFTESHVYKIEKCLFGTTPEEKSNCNDGLGIIETIDISNKTYREFLYQGKEYESRECTDSRSEQIKGYSGNYQRYYMRGRLAANFACERFINNNEEYICCTEKSQRSACIEYMGTHSSSIHVFCNKGESCDLSEAHISDEWVVLGDIANFFSQVNMGVKQRGNKLCVSTTNLCPFNHHLGGGSREMERYCEKNEANCRCVSEEGVARGCYSGVKNFCQFNKHCTFIPNKPPYKPQPEISPYFDRACIDFIGSSQNIPVSQSGGLFSSLTTADEESFDRYSPDFKLSITYQGFTAPIVECVKETIENIFKNEAGHSKCFNPNEIPHNEICLSGNYFYQQGQDLSEVSGAFSKGAFSFIQSRLKIVVRLIIIFAITLFGAKTIIQAGGVERKTVMMLLVKIALIYYFVTGNAWKDVFFDGVYGASSSIGTIVMKVGSFQATQLDEEEPARLDGCQFDRARNSNYSRYGDRTYLSIFDTIDCKIIKYLGMDDKGIANLFIFALSTIFIGPLGIIIFFGSIIFALFLISFIIKTTYIFLVSFIAISVMIYLSPVIIPLVLFEKTRGIFDSAVKNTLSFILQPVILYAYVGIFLTLLDGVVTGDAVYNGIPPKKQINCSERCETIWGSILHDVPLGDCVLDEMQIVDPKDNSLLCTFKTINDAAKSWGILAPIGVLAPIADEEFRARAFDMFLLVVKAIFVVYIVSSFLKLVPKIASTITGGAQMKELDKGIKVGSMMTGSYAIMKMISRITKRSVGLTAGKAAKGGAKGIHKIASGIKKRKRESAKKEKGE
ncbi:type IV secretion system protein [Pseudomonadota bacterium]